MNKEEIFRVIDEYQDYMISNYGNVFSTKTNKLMKKRTCKGYEMVNITVGGKHITLSIHRLVAKAFIPNPDNCSDVNHKDYDRSNNCVDNLEWISHHSNITYSMCNRPVAFSKSQCKTGEHHVYYIPNKSVYKVMFRGRGLNIQKCFKTLNTAVSYRNSIMAKIGG